MAIAGAFDIHRRQITFDFADTETGQVQRGRIAPATRVVLRDWLGQFGRDDVTFTIEAAPGGGSWSKELQAAGITALLAEPAETAHQRGEETRQDGQGRRPAVARARRRRAGAAVVDPARAGLRAADAAAAVPRPGPGTDGMGAADPRYLVPPRRPEPGRAAGPTRAPGPLGSGQPPAEDPGLASWLPVQPGLTPHGLRHGHQTWMEEAGISDLLRSERMGHEVPGMRGFYGHVSPSMRADLKAMLQERWERSLRERTRFSQRSVVPVLDALLATQREQATKIRSHLAPRNGHSQRRRP
jgi:hypothetical protein